ncbi:MAG: DUF4349 domain-containing protein [Clostridia bacterium]|nr:DUF4349 domain-containing protein [Clostridia bacterium]
MKNRKQLSIISLVLILLLTLSLLTSCGGGKETAADGSVGGYGGDTGESMNSSTAPSDPGLTDSSLSLPDMTGKAGTKVIKTFTLSAETTDFDTAIASLTTLVTEHEGYVESSNTTNQSLSGKNQAYIRRANYTLRIPAEAADAFVSSLGNSLHVTSNSSTVEDVSENYYSIEARLEELQVERDSLLEILDSPETTKDYNLWLTVKQRLSEVTQQIAVYQGQLNRYDSKIAYSTVNLSITEVLNYTSTAEDNSFGSRMSAAFSEGWTSFVEGTQSFAVFLAENFPGVIIFLLIANAAWIIPVTIVKKQKAKNAARHKQANDKTDA